MQNCPICNKELIPPKSYLGDSNIFLCTMEETALSFQPRPHYKIEFDRLFPTAEKIETFVISGYTFCNVIINKDKKYCKIFDAYKELCDINSLLDIKELISLSLSELENKIKTYSTFQ